MLVFGPLELPLLATFGASKLRTSFVTRQFNPCFLEIFQAHNLKVVSSNPTPATNTIENAHIAIRLDGGFFVLNDCHCEKMRKVRLRQ